MLITPWFTDISRLMAMNGIMFRLDIMMTTI